jgi:hypothetical protein
MQADRETMGTHEIRSPQAESSDWTPRSRFLAALRGEMPDRVPTVIWSNKLPGDPIDQALPDAGMHEQIDAHDMRIDVDKSAP